MPNDEADHRLTNRSIQLLKPEVLVASQIVRGIFESNSQKKLHFKDQQIGECPKELEEWESAILTDPQYIEALESVKAQSRKFPNHLDLKLSISECTLSGQGRLLFEDENGSQMGGS
ncbi:hypothetical protein K3495_g16919 [Podosphaera aphanis]|nr:hypothetical protein K3495_g16919 [Podosphaera aphanis]